MDPTGFPARGRRDHRLPCNFVSERQESSWCTHAISSAMAYKHRQVPSVKKPLFDASRPNCSNRPQSLITRGSPRLASKVFTHSQSLAVELLAPQVADDLLHDTHEPTIMLFGKLALRQAFQISAYLSKPPRSQLRKVAVKADIRPAMISIWIRLVPVVRSDRFSTIASAHQG